MTDQITHCEECKEVIDEEDFEQYVDNGRIFETGYNCHCGFKRRYEK